MEIVKLAEPGLRSTDLHFESYTYVERGRTYLRIPDDLGDQRFVEVFENRRTKRSFGSLTLDDLSNLLWVAAKTRSSFRESSGFVWQHRASPSAGGRHPIDLAVIAPPTLPADVYIYDSIGHSLIEIVDASAPTKRFISTLDNVIPKQDGTIIWFIAQYLRTGSKYINPESLVWRDAGALLATISFAAEALKLNCCAYGLTGDNWVAEIFGGVGLGGAGGCVVGARQEG